MRFLVLGFLALLGLIGELPAAVRTKVDLVNLTPDIRPGAKALVAVRFRCDPHFHIYWKNPGDAGQPPTITWSEKSGTSPGSFIWPGPKALNQAGVINFVYEGETLLLVELDIPADAKGELRLKASVEWLECDDGGCYPQAKPVALTLKVGPGNESLRHDPKLYPALRPVLETTGKSDGKNLRIDQPKGHNLTKTWFPEGNFVVPGVVFAQKANASGLEFSLAEATEPLKSPLRFTTQDEDGGFTEVLVDLTEPKPVAPASGTESSGSGHAGSWEPWSPEGQAKALAEGKVVYVDFTARWCATCQVNKRVYGQKDVEKAFASGQVVRLKADWTRKDAVITAELSKYGRQGIPLNVVLKSGVPPAILSEALTGSEVVRALEVVASGRSYQSETETAHSFGFWLALAFGGGVLLNLMPCVFPMIGLKVLAFAQEAGAARRNVIRNGLLYSLGVVLSFLSLALLIIALKSGGDTVGWGFQMQSPGFVLGTCALMVTLGLSLAGVFEIGTGFAGSAAEAQPQGGPAGAFFSGVLATAVATPCTAPGLGAALGFALDQTRTGGETLLFFTVIGLGMALPYLLLVLFPALTSRLPRPGEWMESLKQAMSFPLFAYALYLLWVLNALVEDAAWVRDASIGLALLGAACWIWGRWGAPHRSDRERFMGKTLAGLVYVLTLGYLYASLP